MTDSLCRSALISSADKVSDMSQELASTWEPIVQQQKYQAVGANLENGRQRLESVLEKLKNICRPENDKPSKPEIKPRDTTRLKFIKTTSAVKKQMDDVEKLLLNNEDVLKMPNKLNKDSSEHKELQRRSAQKLAELNAAIAALVRATSDSANPDFITAEGAINTISQLTPEIVQNTNKLCEYADDQQRLEMLNNIRSLCNANKLICDSLENNDFKELKDSANKFANSSGQLCVVFNPRANPIQENLILDLSEQACEKTAKLLSQVYELAEKVGGEDGHKLDRSGARVADSAQALITTAQLTAPTMNNDQCRSEMIRSADTVSSLTQDLACVWEPIVQNPNHQALGGQLIKDRDILEAVLEKLRNACKPNNDKPSKPEIKPRDSTQLKFIKTTSAVKKQMDDVEKLIVNNENAMKMPHKINRDSSEHKELQRRFAQKLAELNAAIAALVRATSDSANPDYITAEGAINTISQLTPEIVQNTNKLCEYADDQKRLEMLNNIRSLCNANKLICDSLEKNDFKELKDSANKFANSSGQLCVVFNPRANPIQENLILDLSEQACEKTAKLLSQVYELAEKVGGEDGHKLDRSGARVADSAQALITTAQLTAPTMNNDQCRSEMITSADAVSSLTQDLACVWEPIVQNPNHQALGGQLNKDRDILEAVLEKLRNACKPNNDKPSKPEIKPRDSTQLKFIKTTSAVKKQMDDVEKLIVNNENAMKMPHKINRDSSEHKELQRRSAQKLAELNAAIAALVRATSDSANPDYITAEGAINTISQLTPEMVQNTNKLCEYADDQQRLEMLNNIRSLCNANKLICDSLEKNDFKELKDSANKFANSSGQLCVVFNPRANPIQENLILDLSEQACEKTAKLLSHVYELAEKVGGEDGYKLDRTGARVADSAQALMTTAQLTAPTMNNDQCRSEMITSADAVSSLTQDLACVWEPIVQNPNHQALGGQLNKDRDILEAVLEKLRNACKPNNDKPSKPEIKPRDSTQLKFIKTTSAVKKQMDDVEKLILNNENAMKMPHKINRDSSEHKELQRRFAQKLAELNAAIAALVRATSDSANPDYITAEGAINTISQLTPEIVQNTNKLCEYADDQQRLEMLNNIRSLCNANKLICDSLEKNDFKELKDSANKFANSSGQLCVVFNPRANPIQENLILDLSEQACEKTAKLLSHVYKLAEKVGGENGYKLDRTGARVADSAQALMTTAQLTAPTMNNDQCRSEMIRSADAVSNLTQDLACVWEPIVQNPNHQALGGQLNKDREILEAVLEKLRNACKPNNETTEKEKQRPKFITITSTAKKQLDEAEHLLLNSADIAMKPKTLKINALAQRELQFESAQKLGELNAAIANLVRAASDGGDLDYNTAEQTIMTISKLTPEIIQNTTKLCEYADKEQSKAMLDNVKEICNANKIICDRVEGNDYKELNDAATNYSKPSGLLCSLFNQRVHPVHENKILDLSEEVCRKSSGMLAGVYELAEQVGGESGFTLDRSGAKVADATQALLTIAQIVTPTIPADRCQSAMIASADSISGLSQKLVSTWEPIVKDPKYQSLGGRLNNDRKMLEIALEKLRNACNDTKEREKKRHEFISTMPAAIKKLVDAEELIKQNNDFVMDNKKRGDIE
ncbi:uncharacterized protein [Epargyreus clarus]|uniref:uncharacterized protein n=1 Tax=Epargyreus clarus TaxID=520877 RepID=UPI003C2B73D1